ncbi:Ankyrin repeat-containing domain [Phytophthora cactorum]|nr:Ankyrin repeat-containing domain [Phytophthora cactorum]
MNYAAKNRHLDVMRFLLAHRQEGCTVLALDAAAARGDFVVLELLLSECSLHVENWPIDAGLAAITSDRVEILHWLLQHFVAPEPHRRMLYNTAQYYVYNRAHILAYLDGYWTIEA